MLALPSKDMPEKLIKPKLSVLLILPTVWLGSISLILVTLILTMFINIDESKPQNKYSMYSSKPLVLGIMTDSTNLGDPRSAKIDKVFEKYNCPLQGMGKVFVEEADNHNIPYWLVAAVAFQESSCGKMTPEPGGVESYNAWGWAVYGDNVKMFDSWEHGISVVSKYMYETFYSKGITDACEIMNTYTPPSQGSWCAGVNYFTEIIDEYKSPIE